MGRLSPLLFAATLLVAACADQGTTASIPDGGAPSVQHATYQITIANMAFSPLNLEVPPGAAVTVVNEDSMDHSVTSEAAIGKYTPGGVGDVSFDTGPFMGEKSFAIPADAPDGAVVHYYCSVHRSAMTTPTGTITINASLAGGGGN